MAKLGSSNVYGDLSVSRNVAINNELTIGQGAVTLSDATDRPDLLLINSNTTGWCGLQITNNDTSPPIWSLMANGSVAGIYDDLNSDWHVYCTQNSSVQLRFNGTTKLETSSTGITVTGVGTATDWEATSDIKFKENIRPLNDSLSKTLNIRGVRYNRKDDKDKDERIGIVAQELEKIYPEFVSTYNDENTGESYKTVNYPKLTAVLIESIKEQQKTIDTQQEQLNRLEEKIDNIIGGSSSNE